MAKAKPSSTEAPRSSAGPKPVYALVGTDAFLQLQKLSEISAAMGPNPQRLDIDGERAGLVDVLDELRCFAMFGSAKLVVVRSADAFVTRFREPLEDYLASPSDSGTLVLRLEKLPANQRIYKLIAKVGVIENCEAPTDVRTLTQWVIRHAGVHGTRINPDAAELLADMIGGHLARLDSELEKLAIQCGSSPINAAAVGGSVSFQRDQEMWAMTNELASGQPADALKRWRQLVQTDTSAEFRAVTWLTMWLEDVGVVLASKRGMGPGTGKLTWKYKDRLNGFMRTAESLGQEGYARALDLLAQIDHQTKTGVGDAVSNVERFILTFNARV